MRGRARISTNLTKLTTAGNLSVILVSALVALFASVAALLLVTLMWDQLQEVGQQEGGNSPEAQESVNLPGARDGQEGAPKDEVKPPPVPEKKANPSEVPVEQEGVRRGANPQEMPDRSGEVQ